MSIHPDPFTSSSYASTSRTKQPGGAIADETTKTARSRQVRGPTERMTMSQIELSAGIIEYEDTGGEGPTLVLLHGLLMDASLWDDVIADLSVDHRCVVPTLPLGAHRHAMHADADLSLRGIARLVTELLDRLDLRSCSSATAPPASAGSFSPPATRSTTFLRA
jgi:hypothetical protein